MRKNAVTYMMLRAAALIVALVLLFSIPVLAVDRLDENHTASLSAVFEYGGVRQTGVEFTLYKVADMSGFGTYAPCGDFAGYPVADMNGLDSDGWRNMALTLAGYAAYDAPIPAATAVTDANGRASFGSGLDVGLYLLVGGMGEGCAAQPVLVSVPGLDENGQWIYDVTVNVKAEAVSEDETTQILVIKIWDDAGYDSRPESIDMVLLGDGEVVDTVTLSRENSWRHTWTDLDSSVIWNVIEYPVPENYIVLAARDGEYVMYTNWLREEGGDDGGEEEPDVPGATESPDEPGSTEAPDNPFESGDDGGDGSGGDTRLPQTGLLWWPVPVLACAGMALFAIGWLYRRKDEE